MPITLKTQMLHPATARDIFPLLCPVRETEWIPAWQAEVVRSDSGVSEPGAIFQTMDGRTWVVARYEAPHHISFVIVLPELWYCRLSIHLENSEADTCKADICYTWYPVSAEGEMSARQWKKQMKAHLRDWETLLNAHLSARV